MTDLAKFVRQQPNPFVRWMDRRPERQTRYVEAWQEGWDRPRTIDTWSHSPVVDLWWRIAIDGQEFTPPADADPQRRRK